MLVTELGISIFSSLVPTKRPSAILTKVFGSLTVLIGVRPKANTPNSITVSGRSKLVISVKKKADCSIFVTLLGKITLVTFAPKNASLSIIFTELSIVREPIHFLPSRSTPCGINTE